MCDIVFVIAQFMDVDYHDAFQRLIQAYYQTEVCNGDNIKRSMGGILEQAKALNFANDVHYFLSEFANNFANPPEFSFVQYGDDDVSEYKVNAKDVFLRAQEMVKSLQEEISAVEFHQEEVIVSAVLCLTFPPSFLLSPFMISLHVCLSSCGLVCNFVWKENLSAMLSHQYLVCVKQVVTG